MYCISKFSSVNFFILQPHLTFADDEQLFSSNTEFRNMFKKEKEDHLVYSLTVKCGVLDPCGPVIEERFNSKCGDVKSQRGNASRHPTTH